MTRSAAAEAVGRPAFTVFPAIDLQGGACVRLRRGAMDQATVYAADPAAQAAAFVAEGARWLHVVDLDGAAAGRPVNAPAVRAIISAAIPVQLGGGIRRMADIERWLGEGVARVILGSVALKDPALVRDAAAAFPGRVAVAIDARDGFVATEGWAETSSVPAVELARRMAKHPLAAIIFTDIARDGMLVGVNVAATSAMSRAVPVPVIASGGVANLADIEAVANAGGIAGVIVGRALYEKRFTIREALRAEEAGAMP